VGRVTARRRASHLTADTVSTRPETLAVEEPLELRINGTAITVTMRTPGSDVELAQGFLLTEGVIGQRDDIARVEYCRGAAVPNPESLRSSPPNDGTNTYNVLDVSLAPGVPMPDVDVTRNFYTTSSCGVCGKGSMLVVREDIGRHNAVDKVIGWAVEQERIPLSGTVLLVSGRASFELTQKAVMAGIPVLAAVSAPSSLAVDLASQAGLTLVAFLRGESMNVYTRQDRVTHAG